MEMNEFPSEYYISQEDLKMFRGDCLQNQVTPNPSQSSEYVNVRMVDGPTIRPYTDEQQD